MNYWKLKWGDIEREFARKIDTENILRAYFEDEETIFVFISLKGILCYAEVPKNQLEDPNAFKMEFLSGAYELQENPLNVKPVSLVIRQEM